MLVASGLLNWFLKENLVWLYQKPYLEITSLVCYKCLKTNSVGTYLQHSIYRCVEAVRDPG